MVKFGVVGYFERRAQLVPLLKRAGQLPVQPARSHFPWSVARLFLHEFSNRSEEIRTVYIALGVHGNTFRHTRTTRVWIRTRIGNQVLDRTVPGASNSNAPLTARIVSIAGRRQSGLSGVGP